MAGPCLFDAKLGIAAVKPMDSPRNKTNIVPSAFISPRMWPINACILRTHANVVGGGLLCSDEQHLELDLDSNGRSFYCEGTKDIPNRENKTVKETANTVEPFSPS